MSPPPDVSRPTSVGHPPGVCGTISRVSRDDEREREEAPGERLSSSEERVVERERELLTRALPPSSRPRVRG